MQRPKIVAHSIVKNEQNWIWYSLMSVLDFVDEIMVWDTGSTDNTINLVNSIHNSKIKLFRVDDVNPDSFTSIRQKMLDSTKADWLMILDGDEIWPHKSITKTMEFIRSSKASNTEYLIHPYYDLLGDVFHYQEPRGGRYRIDKYYGHVTVRFLNLTLLPRLHFGNPHGQQGIFDADQVLIQNRLPHRHQFMHDCNYLHTTHLRRSTDDNLVMKRDFKYKFEVGKKFLNNYSFPIPFYFPAPGGITPWKKADLSYWLMAYLQSPLKFFKRRLVSTPSGY